MFTKSVLAGTSAKNLKELMETAGVVFPNDNDSCTGLILQLDPKLLTDPAYGDTVDIMSAGETEGITLTQDQPTSISFQEYELKNVYLKASAASVKVKCLVEQRGR